MTARENIGTGARIRVLPKCEAVSYWKNFLRNDDNKDELFQFLANASVSQDTGCDSLDDSQISCQFKYSRELGRFAALFARGGGY